MHERVESIREVMTKERQLPFDPWKLLFRAALVVIGGGLCAAGVGLLTERGPDETEEYGFALIVLAIGALNVIAAFTLRRWAVVAAVLGTVSLLSYMLLIVSNGAFE